MAPKLSHDEWMAHEFEILKRKHREKKLGYREALLHTSFVEGLIRRKCKAKGAGFDRAISWLCIHKKITKDEKKALQAVAVARNLLVHEIVKRGASEEEILRWRDDLMDKVLDAYHKSPFLKAELLTKYGIDPKDLPKPSSPK